MSYRILMQLFFDIATVELLTVDEYTIVMLYNVMLGYSNGKLIN